MTKEEYKKRKLEDLKEYAQYHYCEGEAKFIALKDAESFLSQTIDEVWKLPEERELSSVENLPHIKNNNHWRNGWNACIAEAERMRDNQKK